MAITLQELPPKCYLMQVLNHCPKAGSCYVELWSRRDLNNRILVEKNRILDDFMMSLRRFKHDLMLLSREMLISYRESANQIQIELVGWEDEEMD